MAKPIIACLITFLYDAWHEGGECLHKPYNALQNPQVSKPCPRRNAASSSAFFMLNEFTPNGEVLHFRSTHIS